MILLDKNIPELGQCVKAVFQDFEMDIYEVLNAAARLLKKYSHIRIIFPAYTNHPAEIIQGVERFSTN